MAARAPARIRRVAITTETRLNPKDSVRFGGIETTFDGDDIEPDPNATRPKASGTTPVTVAISTPAEPPIGGGSPFAVRKDSKGTWTLRPSLSNSP